MENQQVSICQFCHEEIRPSSEPIITFITNRTLKWVHTCGPNGIMKNIGMSSRKIQPVDMQNIKK